MVLQEERLFSYMVVCRDQRVMEGTLQAPTLAVAKDRLLSQYAHILDLKEQTRVKLEQLFKPRPRLESLVIYTRQLATMIEAGVSIHRGFEFVAEGDDKPLNEVMRKVAASIARGNSVSRALMQHRQVFGDVYIALVRSAEQSGRLHSIFRKLASLMEKNLRLRRQVMSALTYPVVIAVTSIALFSLFVFYVIPMLLPLFTEVGLELPWPTRVMLAVGNTLSNPVLVGTVLAALGAGYHFIFREKRFPELQRKLDELTLRLPLVSRIARLSISSRVLHTFAAMMDAGLSISQILPRCARVAGNRVVEERLLEAAEALVAGKSLSQALEAAEAFAPLVVQMVRLGEESGTLPQLLRRVGDMYEDDLEHELTALASLIEPMMMGVVGIVVGFIVIASFLPLIGLIAQF